VNTTRWLRPIILAGTLAAMSAAVVVARQASSVPSAGDGAFVAAGGPTETLLESDAVVVSPGSGGVPTKVLDAVTLHELGAGFPFGPGFGSSVMTAAGELSGDTTPDVAVATGPGAGLVRLYNGATIAEIGSGFPFGGGFTGGVSLAVGDFNGDGRADIVTGQASGGGAVRVFSGTNYALLMTIAPFGGGYSGGVNVAAGDIDGDGRAEVIAGQAGGSGVVAVVSAVTQTVTVSGSPYGPIPGGVFVAAGDVNGDGRADVIAAPGSGAAPLLVYDVSSLTLLSSFTPYGSTSPGGVRVAATDLTGDGRADIITIPGPGRDAELKIFSGANFSLLATRLVYPAGYLAGAFVSVPKARGGLPNPGKPGAPTNLDFTVLGATVELRWGPPSSGGTPTSYRIDAGSQRGLSDLVSVNVGNVTRFVTTAPAGVFFVRVVALNALGASPPSNEVVVVTAPRLGTGEFSATLTWDTQTDIDLHVDEPSGFHIFYRDPSTRRGPTALLDFDNTLGFGPENIFTDRRAATGTYEVYVVPYAGQPNRWPTTARVTVRTNVGTPAEAYRVFTRTFSGPNTTVAQNVATVTFPGGIIAEKTGTRSVTYDRARLTTVGPSKR
jgi:hypothetical protein